MHHKGLIDREFHYVYIAEIQVSIDKLNLQEEEVAAIKLVPVNKLMSAWSNEENNGEYVPYTTPYFKMVFDAIQDRIQ